MTLDVHALPPSPPEEVYIPLTKINDYRKYGSDASLLFIIIILLFLTTSKGER